MTFFTFISITSIIITTLYSIDVYFMIINYYDLGLRVKIKEKSYIC